VKTAGYKSYIILTLIFCAFTTLPAQEGGAEVEDNPLQPIKTDSPRDTMRSFYTAMDDYREGLETKDPELLARIDDATRTCLLYTSPSPRD